jgi:hypothetical protein
MQCRELTLRRELKDRPAARIHAVKGTVGRSAASDSCSIEIAVGGLKNAAFWILAIGAESCDWVDDGTKAVKRVQLAF